jgi:uncharacterized membrane protein
MKLVQALSLLAATMATGLTAGLLAAFVHTIMPTLHRTDDRVFVDVMNKINAIIVNGWFLLCFLGALAFTGLATILHLRGTGRPVLPWIIAGLVLYGLVIVITFAVNIPLNNQLAEAGERAGDLHAARQRYEGTWVTWNVIRTVVNVAAFGCLGWALVLHGTHREPARRTAAGTAAVVPHIRATTAPAPAAHLPARHHATS